MGLCNYLDNACPPGQYMAQYGSSKGQSSGLSRQKRQFGVNKRNLTSGVRLSCPPVSVFSEINLLIDSLDLNLASSNVLTNVLKHRLYLCGENRTNIVSLVEKAFRPHLISVLL